MAHHAVAGAAPQDAAEQGAVLVPDVAPAGPAVTPQLGLHPLEGLGIHDGIVLAFVDFLLVPHLTDVSGVCEERVERGLVEGSSAPHGPFAGGPPLRPPASVVEFVDHLQKRSAVEVELKDLTDEFGLDRIDNELGIDDVVAQDWHAARPLPLAAGGGDLVPGPLADHLPLELGKGETAH